MDKLAAITGDAVYNYRSALNHMVYALAVRESGMDPPPFEPSLEFPICSVNNCWDSSIGRNRLAGLTPVQVAAIKAAQPCNRSDPGGLLLARLRDLSNADKHRTLNFSVLAVHEPQEIEVNELQAPVTFWLNGEPLYDGAPVAQLVFDAPHPPVEMSLHLTTTP